MPFLIRKDKKARLLFKLKVCIDLITFGFIPYNSFQKKRKVKTLVILGMHRSATSMISRSIHLSGEGWIGDNLILNQGDNIRGHYEQIPIVILNEKILKIANGSWDKPPSR